MMDANKSNIQSIKRQSSLKFSVAICVYRNDYPEHFKEAMESIINQTVPPDEIVLVVDGPVPESTEGLINNFSEMDFIKVIRFPKNVGHGNARRRALENCSYNLVALMDADDISVPDRFEKQLQCFEQEEHLSIVGGNIIEFIDSLENQVSIRSVPQTHKEITDFMKKRCPFNQTTVMMKLEDVERAGGYFDWYMNEDYYLWIRMFLNGAYFRNISEYLVFVRVGNAMYQRRGGWKYFLSEAKLQRYMLKNDLIDFVQFSYNLIVRFFVQVVLPPRLRGVFFRTFARSKPHQT